MSILQQTTTPPTINGEIKAAQIKRSISATGEQLYHNWISSFDALWNNNQVSAEEIISALGTDAAEVFYLSAAMVEFMTTVFTGRRDDLLAGIQARLATLPEFTINEDGTVTITPAP